MPPPSPPGEEAEAAAFGAAAPPIVAHVPDADPALAPPSNSAVGSDIPGVALRPAALPQPAAPPLIVPGMKLPGGAGLMPGVAS
jgi:hypothetical protein